MKGVVVGVVVFLSMCGAHARAVMKPIDLPGEMIIDEEPQITRATFQKQFGRVNGIGPGSADAVVELVGRVLGEQAKSLFNLTIESVLDQSGSTAETDTFVIRASPKGGPIAITANSGVALASGVMWYLKYSCNLSVSWGYPKEDGGWTCDNLQLPAVLPAVPTSIRVSSPYAVRYYQNVCTVSYSMAWWDWQRWQRELDWMALEGINLPLAFTGQEFVWAKVYASLGVTEDELEATFGGPAFLAWARMGNIKGWAGPLLPSWRQRQADMQKQILARMLELGLIPVLGAFDGHVPEALSRIFPKANITRSASWGNFNDTYTRDFLLDPFDPLFPQIGKLFLQAQSEVFGNVTHIYQCDTFNEMDPSSGEGTYLQAYSRAVYQAMAGYDPHAVWLMQGWLFHSGFWTDDRMASYLSGVASTNMIILDLNSEQDPLWQKFVANKKPFVWCMLHNYGGLRDLHGDVSLVAHNPILALESAGALMLGTGITMEAIEQNPIMYELMNEMGWHNEFFDHVSWVIDYAHRRYGFMTDTIQNAWKVLLQAAYSRNFSWSGNWIGVHAPALQMSYDTSQDPSQISVALEMLVEATSDPLIKNITGGLQYDLVDLTRQVLSNFFYDVHSGLSAAFADCFDKNDDKQQVRGVPPVNCNKTVEAHIQTLNQMFDDMETILSSDVNYLLGYWISSARAWGQTSDEQNQYEFNARNQVTLWGPDGNINDYAAKAWAGLVGTYYKQRWSIFFDTIRTSIVQKNPNPDWNQMNDKLISWGRKFDGDKTPFPASPVGDTRAIASELESKYNMVRPGYTSQPDTASSDASGVLLKSWTTNAGQLSIMCDLDDRCLGFSTNGQLLWNVSSTTKSSGVTLYTKTK